MTKPHTGAHKSRAQESRDANPVHEDDSIFMEESGPLPDIDARTGYAQRWVRILRGTETDTRNIYSATRQGWQPRKADSVPKNMQWLIVQNESFGGVIGSHDLILMERPEELDRKAQAYDRAQRVNLDKAVKSNLFSEHKQLGGETTGFSTPGVDHSAQVERGRPLVADD